MAWRSKIQDRIRIELDVPVEVRDGVTLRADIYCPREDGAYPVILSYGPYGKLQHYADGSPYAWNRMKEENPDSVQGTTNEYQVWEVVDPEKWVPDGYAVVRVDSRGAGRSPGHMEPLSPIETQDLYECIEWAGQQSWSNGKVGLNGISYYGMNQWQVAALQPPHLAAMCIWEGSSDIYREMFYHGGIASSFPSVWFEGRIATRQHGLGSRGPRSRINGDWVAGPETLPLEVLEARRTHIDESAMEHPFFDEYWRSRVPDLSKITVPLLSAGNWGGAGLHLRGNIEGFTGAASDSKWLEMHGNQHWAQFYTDYGVGLQKRFFGCFLKGEVSGWKDQAPLQLQIRHPGEQFEERKEREWPLARTNWTEYYIWPDGALATKKFDDAQHQVSYEALGEGLTFLTAPLIESTEITGPASAKLYISADTEDCDVFVILRVFDPNMREVTFHGSNEPHAPVAHGWLRASHRRLDPELSLPYRPYHSHDIREPLHPGKVYEVDVEIWPTSIVIPVGYRLGVSLRGKDHMWQGDTVEPLAELGEGSTAGAAFSGVGPFRHNERDRAPSLVGGRVTLHWDAGCQPRVLLPVIPQD